MYTKTRQHLNYLRRMHADPRSRTPMVEAKLSRLERMFANDTAFRAGLDYEDLKAKLRGPIPTDFGLPSSSAALYS
jgi:hypothetical protein